MNEKNPSISLRNPSVEFPVWHNVDNIPGGTREWEEQLEKQDVRSRVSPTVFSQHGLICKDCLNQSANDKCDSYAEARGVGKFAESSCRGLIYQHETPHIQVSLATLILHNSEFEIQV